jgi:hypothetical protein
MNAELRSMLKTIQSDIRTTEMLEMLHNIKDDLKGLNEKFDAYVDSDSKIIEAELNEHVMKRLGNMFKGFNIEPYHNVFKSITHPLISHKSERLTEFDGLFRLTQQNEKTVFDRTSATDAPSTSRVPKVDNALIADVMSHNVNLSNMSEADRQNLQVNFKKVLPKRMFVNGQTIVYVIVEAKRHLTKELFDKKVTQYMLLKQMVEWAKHPMPESLTLIQKSFWNTAKALLLKQVTHVDLIFGSVIWDADVKAAVQDLIKADQHVHMVKLSGNRFETIGGSKKKRTVKS